MESEINIYTTLYNDQCWLNQGEVYAHNIISNIIIIDYYAHENSCPIISLKQKVWL